MTKRRARIYYSVSTTLSQTTTLATGAITLIVNMFYKLSIHDDIKQAKSALFSTNGY